MSLSQQLLPTNIEFIPTFTPRRRISHVVFDFDGTLSWLRHGWPGIMLSLFQKHLPFAASEPRADYERTLMSIVLGMNGKPTILQMIRFAELVQEREDRQLDPEALRQEYQSRLDQEIAERTRQIQSGTVPTDHYVVFGARSLLEHLRDAGLKLSVLSSTVQERVREEAELLQISQYFDGRIYGGVGDPTKFSKMAVFEKLLKEDGIPGEELLSFGDGPVEISNTKSLGGTAIAVCSDEEHNGSGIMDTVKRDQLMQAGADAAIPDFRDAIALTQFLRGQ